MAPYLFGQRNKIHIINLEKTLPLYLEAYNYVSKMASKKGTILFVGTKRSAQSIIAEEAKRCGMPFVNRRWLGGLLTNFKTVRGSINRLKEIEAMQTDGRLERINKKEQLMLKRELEKLEANLSGIKDMKGIPDAIFIIDVGYENIAVSEAVKLGIPVVGVVDSNNSLKGVDYVIPGNDDAIRSISLYSKGMADAILDSRQSIAHLGSPENKDELIEIDESGAPIDSVDDASVKSKDIKKVVKKKTQNKTERVKISDVAPQEAVPDDEQKVIKKVTKKRSAVKKKTVKKTTAKKTTAKKTTAKKTTKKISKKTIAKTKTEE